MNGSGLLARDDAFGSVMKCKSGMVHVNVSGVSLHFCDDAFYRFVGLIKEAESNMVDNAIGRILDSPNEEAN